ncbi:MAG TPA: peptidylprolyl isomerase [Bacteroidales bacterium]|nr:peptidylprolyl isomerase [Bacteroidales bacterium]
MSKFILIVFIPSVIIFTSCRNDNNRQSETNSLSKEQLTEINRQLLIKDRERIESYIERKGLKMKETETGLWISKNIPEKGNINYGDNVVLEYVCSLLDGTEIYNSNNEGLMKFSVGKSNIPSGLNEGVQLLEEGSEAILILPGYLGYGLLGDENRIPARSILVYKVKVVEVN